MAKELVMTNEVLFNEHWGTAGDRLAQVAPGTIVRVDRVHGDELLRGKMMAMGIVPGASLSVVQGGSGRPLLIALAGGRFLIDSRSSELVSVRMCREEEGSV